MAVVPQQILDYISRQDEEDELRARIFPEGMLTTREGMTGEGVTAGDIVDVYQDLGTSLLPVDAIEAFSEGDILGGIAESGEYLAEFTRVPALYRTGEALFDGDYGRAAFELGTTLSPNPRMFEAIRDGDRLSINDELPVGTVTRESNRFPEGTPRKLFSSIDNPKKGDTPPSEFTAVKEQVDVPTVGTKLLMPEDLENSTIISLLGDRTDAGSVLLEVGDTPLAFPVKLDGGLKYMTYNPENTWAVGGSFGKRYDEKVKAAADKGDVYLSYAPMSALGGSDFSNMTTLTLAAQVPNLDIPKKSIKDFNEKIKSKFPDFVGIESKDIQSYIENSGGEVNKFIVDTMDSRSFRDAGFPDVGQTRLAITDRQLDSVPTGFYGTGIQKVDPQNFLNLDTGHSSYGQGFRRFEDSPRGMFSSDVPPQLAFRDFIQEQRRGKGKDVAGDARAIQLSIPSQYYDAEYVDTLSKFLEEDDLYKRLGLDDF